MLMVAFAGVICWFTIMAFMLFSPTSEEAKAYFTSFGGGMWNMLMVLNGSNWPSPMIPAYQVRTLRSLSLSAL